MKTIDDCLGEKLSEILIKPNKDFVSPDHIVLADEINFLLEKTLIRILPVIDTDELVVAYFDWAEMQNLDDCQTYSTAFTSKKLSAIWHCQNTNGYADLFIVGFQHLQPSLLILSEGSVLKIFAAKQLGYET